MKPKQVRYAVVGLGWIAQETVIPGFQNAANSELAALFTDDPEKALELALAYGVPRAHSYQEYDDFLKSGAVDAVYLALPNSLHAEFAIRAARAGVHVLCEKPMAASIAECEQMIRAVADTGVKLMIAYRLHFEPANLKVVDMVAACRLGEPRIFSAVFAQQVAPGNIRLRKDLGGGPLMDMGVYPINAARYVFRNEPVEVFAFGTKNTGPRFEEVHETVSATMRFPGDKLAAFTCSFGAAQIDTWTIVGTEGVARLEPGFEYHEPMKLHTSIQGQERVQEIAAHDQFGAELMYFSNCILEGRQPEPSGFEGLADLRVVEALIQSMRDGAPVPLPEYQVPQRPGIEQKIELPPVEAREMVNVKPPSGD